MKRAVTLVILDGFGIGRRDTTNPAHRARMPNLDALKRGYRYGALEASGIAVGLPWGKAGSGETGYLAIGAGRTVYQDYPRITLALRSGGFAHNPAITSALLHAQKNGGVLHLVGLISESDANASREHLIALLTMAREWNIPVRLHCITDGTGGDPRSFPRLLAELEAAYPNIIASVSGRHYAMDEGGNADRTGAACAAIMGNGPRADDLVAYTADFYVHGLNDEFIEPAHTALGEKGVEANDAIFFFNFGGSGTAPLASMLMEKAPEGTHIATMTEYTKGQKAHVAFPQDAILGTLGEAVAASGRFQLRVAETTSFAHVTKAMNGNKDEPLTNEYRIMIPAGSAARPDTKPEMMTKEIAERAMQGIEEGLDLVIASFVSLDAVAHTGNFEAEVRALEAMDAALGTIMKAAFARGAALIITSDHGNAEAMRDPKTGVATTSHDTNPVPLIVAGAGFEHPKTPAEVAGCESEIVGTLADVAPTLLAIMGIMKPAEMTGSDLLQRLQ